MDKNPIISLKTIANHYFIEATFHHAKNYEELIIVIFKDIIIHENLHVIICY